MFNPIDETQKAELLASIDSDDLSEVPAKIFEHMQNSLALVQASDENEKDASGTTRLGGLPDVPTNWKWPDGMEFLAQINLEEAALYDHNNLLPKQGLLSFFFSSETWNSWTAGRPHRVFHFDNSHGPLKLSSAPDGFLPHQLSGGVDGVYTPVPIKLMKSITTPAGYTRVAWQNEQEEVDEVYQELISKTWAQIRRMSNHQLLGHHGFMDGDADADAWEQSNNVPFRLRGAKVSEAERDATIQSFDKDIQQQSEMAANSTDPNSSRLYMEMANYYRKKREDYIAYLGRKEEIDRELEEWVLLLQIDSDNATGMQFYDAGFAYFMIRKSDLACARFDRTFANLWTS